MYQHNDLSTLVSQFINNTSQNVFLTGKAGTGKTTLLKRITQNTHKSVIVAAPTGIAAINAGGVTLHSLFQLPFGAFVPDNNGLAGINLQSQINTPRTLLSSFQMHKTKRNMLKKLELLIIDEVSMLRADLLDAIDLILRSVRGKRDVPFGGVQVLFIGDLLQLPPVIKEEEWRVVGKYYSSAFFFNAQILRQSPPLYVELEKIYRQSDETFIKLLNNLRNNIITSDDKGLLNKYYKSNYQQTTNDGVILLTTHNKIADEKNRRALESISERSFFYKAEIEGDFNEYSYPADKELELKVGAQVMFTKNDYSGEQRYFNGKIGVVSKLLQDEIEVTFSDGSEPALAELYTWENKKYSVNKETNEIEENITGTFKQYPLKLAWAITVHKSQGLTFDKAVIDVQNAFAPGQIYVALSRLRSLDGLILSSPIPEEGLQQDASLKSFSSSKKTLDELEQVLQEASKKYMHQFLINAFDFSNLVQEISRHLTSYTKDAKRSVKQQYKSNAESWHKETLSLKEIADKFRNELNRLALSGDPVYLNRIEERLVKAIAYFEPLVKEVHDDIRLLYKMVKATKGTKAFQTELLDLSNLYYGQLQVIYKAQTLVQSAINGTDFDKMALNNPDFEASRETDVKEKKKKEPKKKKEKVDTKKLSFDLCQSGKGIEEIAKERSLARTTIEGHLAHYIALGELDVLKFLEADKVNAIEKSIHKLDTFKLTPLKEDLGSDFTFGEIRLGVAAVIGQKTD